MSNRAFPTIMGLVLLLGALWFGDQSFAEPRYEITDLGSLPGFPDCRASGINELGQIVGSCAASSTPGASGRAFLWEAGVMTDLGTLPGYSVSGAGAINNLGVVVGSAHDNVDFRAVVWSGGVPTDLNDLLPAGSGWELSAASDINDSGQIAGAGKINGIEVAFFLDGGDITSLGTLGGTRSYAFRMNELGQVVGAADTADNETHAFLWDAGVMTQLGPIDGNHSQANDINELGTIVGSFGTEFEGPGPYEPPLPFRWDQGAITVLDPGDTIWVMAGAINNAGLVVGAGSRDDNVATLWGHSSRFELSDLIPPNSGWTEGLGTPSDINDAGQIVGSSRIEPSDGNFHAYLLTPVPPSIPALNDWGMIVMTLLVLTGGCLMILRRSRNNAYRLAALCVIVFSSMSVTVVAQPESAASVCGQDDRVLSSDKRVGRTRPLRCTAFLIEGRPNWLLSAGHCCKVLLSSPGPRVDFNVPLSSVQGVVNESIPEDRYGIDILSIQYQDDGSGDDWCVFGVRDNNVTGMTPLEAQDGLSFRLAQVVPTADGSELRLQGYGTDLIGGKTHNRVLQSAVGPFVDHQETTVRYVVDTDRGSSGSPVEHTCTDVVYAIHTHGGCESPIGQSSNSGTTITHAGLQAALADPQGECADCNRNGTLDSLDISGETSEDCNSNGIPDECEFDEDCQPNGTQDICDIATGTSDDLNGNKIPDECEGLVGACCRIDGGCAVMTSACCVEISGTFQGDETVCANPEVCCLGDGTCEVTPETCCLGASGTVLTEYTECGGDCNENDVADACEAMACCLIDRFGAGYCLEATEDECVQLQGQFNCGLTCSQVYCAGTSGPQGP